MKNKRTKQRKISLLPGSVANEGDLVKANAQVVSALMNGKGGCSCKKAKFRISCIDQVPEEILMEAQRQTIQALKKTSRLH